KTKIAAGKPLPHPPATTVERLCGRDSSAAERRVAAAKRLPTPDRGVGAAFQPRFFIYRLLPPCLELLGIELVPAEQLVEVRAVALREPRRLAHVAARDLQQLREVVARERVPRLRERRQRVRLLAERAAHLLGGDDARGR